MGAMQDGNRVGGYLSQGLGVTRWPCWGRGIEPDRGHRDRLGRNVLPMGPTAKRTRSNALD